MLRRDVERIGIGGRDDDREGPLESFRDIARRMPHRVVRPHVDVAALAGSSVDARQQPAIAAGVEHVDVLRIRGDVSALATADGIELAAGGWHARGAVVLLRAADVVGHVRGREHVVELSRRVVLLGPARAGVDRHVGAAVVAVDHPVGVVRRDPQIVVVAVRYRDAADALPRVGGSINAGVENVDRVLGLGVCVNPGVVERALTKPAVVVHPLPRRARIIRQEHTAFCGFDDRVDPVRIRRRNRDTDLPPQCRWQARVLRQLRPCLAAIGGLEQAAARPSARQRVRRSENLPEAGVEHVRILRVHRQVHGACLVASEQHLVPGLSAVARFEDPAVGVRAVRITERCDVDDVGVRRMDANPADGHRLLEAHVAPGLAGIGRLVDPVTLDDVAAHRDLAHPGVDDVGVGLRDRDGAHRRRLEERVGHRTPCDAPVRCLPQPTTCGAKVVFVRPTRAAGYGNRSSAARRTDRSPA